jgi:hypothetical protein
MLPEPLENEELIPVESPPGDRRCFYRARLGNSLLRVRAWKIAPGTPLHHTPMPSQEVRFTVHNFGVGGLGITLANAEAQTALSLTDRLRLEVVYNDINVLVEGRLRTADVSQPRPYLRTGIRFDGNASNLGYQKARFWLSKITGSVQREEIREKRAAQEQAKLADAAKPAAA